MAELDVLPPAPMAAFETALTADGCARQHGDWKRNHRLALAELPVYLADFVPDGETLTLTYTVTVTDEHNATSTQNVIVTITGTDRGRRGLDRHHRLWLDRGLWSDPSNWETGTVPNADNDAIIITDQLIG